MSNIACHAAAAFRLWRGMGVKDTIINRLAPIAIFAVVLSCPYAIPAFWVGVSRWLNLVESQNPGFLPSPVANQVWYLTFGMLSSFVAITLVNFRRAIPTADRPIAVAGILWFTWFLFRAVWTPGVQWSYQELVLQSSLFFLLMGLLIVGIKTIHVLSFQVMAVLTTLPLSMLAIAQNGGFDPLPYSTVLPGSLEIVQGKQLIASTFGHPNYMGSYLAPIVVMGFSLSLTRGALLVRIISAVACALAIIAMLLGGTRGPLLALAVGIVTYCVVSPLRHFRPGRILMYAAGGVLALVVIVILLPPLRPTFDIADRLAGSKEIASRAFYWRLGVMAFLDSPVWGIGPGQFDRLFWRYTLDMPGVERGGQWHFILANTVRGVRPGQMHNDHLQVLVELGVIGAVFWSALWAGIARRCASVARRATSLREGHVNAAFAGAMAVIFTDAMFGFPFHLPCSGALAWCLIGMYCTWRPTPGSTSFAESGRDV